VIPPDRASLAALVDRHPDGAVIDVWAVAGASRPGISGVHAGALRVRVTAAPERGKANRAIAAELAAVLGTAAPRLVRGTTARSKRYLVVGLQPDEVVDRLVAALE